MADTVSVFVGAVGGMGPLSSIQFYEDVVLYSQESLGVFYNRDYPHLLISNLPVPDLINSLQESELSRKMIVDEIEMMTHAGVKVIALACNTMHLYIDEFRANSSVPILNILEEVATEIKKKDKRKVGILATPTTLHYELYQRALQQQNIPFIIPNANQTADLGVIIPLILGGKSGEQEKKTLLRIIDDMIRQNVDVLLFGCTELGLAIKQEDVPVEIVNSITVLAHSLADISLGKRMI